MNGDRRLKKTHWEGRWTRGNRDGNVRKKETEVEAKFKGKGKTGQDALEG